MNGFQTTLASIAISAVSLTAAHASDFPRLDEALPANGIIPGTEPVFDFDGDSCLPSAGISRTGEQNGGLRTAGSLTGGCRSSDFLNTSNTLHRFACEDSRNSTFCAHFYSLYFEKDQVSNGFGGGHRHDWEHVVIWTQDGVVTHGSYSAHGELTTREAANIPHQGTHLKFVYHKDGALTHAMRFAQTNEIAENPYDTFVTPAIISWYEFSGDGVSNIEMRNRLNRYDYGSANVPLKDSNFLSNINEYKPSDYPEFTQASVEATNPNGPEVALYQHCNYGGYKVLLNEGDFDLPYLQSVGLANDDVSSVQVPAGYTAHLYQHGGFGGRAVTVSGRNISCLNTENFNDDMSSIIVDR